MIWAILALLGIPLWLIVAGLAGSLWSRHQFRKQPGVFPAKLLRESGSFAGFGEKWPPVSSFCVWVHDVLLVHKGLPLVRTLPVPVAAAGGSVEHADTEEVKRLGNNPVLLRFRLDDGSVIQMGAPGDALELAQGPFAGSKAQGEEKV